MSDEDLVEEKDKAKDENIDKESNQDNGSEIGDGDKARVEEIKNRGPSDVSFTGKTQRRRSSSDRRRSVHRVISKKIVTPFSKPPPLTLQNTYRLSAKLPINTERIQIIMDSVIKHIMNIPENHIYNTIKASHLCMDIAAEIRNRVRTCSFDRMRIVVMVRIVEKFQPSCITKIGFLLNAKEDNWTSTEYSTNSFYLNAICYGIYFD